MLQLGLNRNPLTWTAVTATAFALAAVTVPLAGFAAAQTGPATLSGTLTDVVGRILPDAPITLTNTTTSARVESRTSAAGTFSFSDLQPGEYELSASLPGFGGKYRLTLSPGANVSREIPLQIGVVQETIRIFRTMAPAAKPASPPLPMPEYHPESDPCRTSQVGGCLAPPVKLRDVKPQYPAVDSGATIHLHAVIGTDGYTHNVNGIDVAAADQAFAESAVAAVSQWRFRPTRLDGVALETQMNVTVAFVP
jgi:Carboxypeptidase regulatory-like domain/Gram-negative bacterial TonB protein C-terminal